MCAQPDARCPVCGAAQLGERYCENCGTRMQPVCAECGEVGSDSARFCRQCGKAFRAVPPPGRTPIRRGLSASGTNLVDPSTAWASIASAAVPPPVEPVQQHERFSLEFARVPSLIAETSAPTAAATAQRRGSDYAFLHAIAAMIAMVVGIAALTVCNVWVNRSDAVEKLTISLVILGVNAIIWFGTTVWMKRHAGGGMAVLAFFMALFAWPIYVFRQKRGLISRHTGRPAPAYPAYSISAIMMMFSLVLGGIVQYLPQGTESSAVAQSPAGALTTNPTVTAQPTTASGGTKAQAPTPTPTPSAADRQKDANAAAKEVVELSKLEMFGEFNTIYDRIHPDARAKVPRGAAVGWYRNDFAPRGPMQAKVIQVKFLTWKWTVNGKTYANTAEVTYEQRFLDGSVDKKKVRLVKYNGKWRRFFGDSKKFVKQQVNKYVVADAITGTDLSAIPYDVDGFWRQTFEAAGIKYKSADYFQFSEIVRTPCGRIGSGQVPAFYCSGDERVYTSHWFQDAVESQIGDFAWVVVIAHEYGHHVEDELGVLHDGDVYSIQLELEADCLAGVYTQDAEARGLVQPGDIDAVMGLMAVIGDPDGVPVYHPDAHGTSEQRAEAFLNGYNDGLAGCGYTT